MTTKITPADFREYMKKKNTRIMKTACTLLEENMAQEQEIQRLLTLWFDDVDPLETEYAEKYRAEGRT